MMIKPKGINLRGVEGEGGGRGVGEINACLLTPPLFINCEFNSCIC